MKNLIKLGIAVLVVMLNVAANAQTKSTKLENSLLWEVSGNGLSKPSYLYGTVHMICSGDYFLSEKTVKAFDTSNKLVLEINLSDPKEMTNLQQLAMGKEPLSKKLTPEQLSKLNIILQKTAGMTVQQVDAFSLSTIVSLIAVKSFGCTDIKIYEMEFIDKAKKKNIEIAGLETVKSQFEVLENAYSDEELLKMLEELNESETTKLVVTYKSENINEIYKVTTDEKIATDKINKVLLNDRNSNWVKEMPALMSEESVFFAFGAAHLGGESGVINLLRKAGYIVKPIMN